jgi:hypothetical protein
LFAGARSLSHLVDGATVAWKVFGDEVLGDIANDDRLFIYAPIGVASGIFEECVHGWRDDVMIYTNLDMICIKSKEIDAFF